MNQIPCSAVAYSCRASPVQHISPALAPIPARYPRKPVSYTALQNARASPLPTRSAEPTSPRDSHRPTHIAKSIPTALRSAGVLLPLFPSRAHHRCCFSERSSLRVPRPLALSSLEGSLLRVRV